MNFFKLKINKLKLKKNTFQPIEGIMFRLLFLLPVILCIIWYFFLKQNGVPIKQGKKGFIYILAFSALVLGFFILMIQVTQN
ncbi:hypothetical protein CSC79_05765 [Pseudoalteromonas sp. 3D05]|nr:hypothetical protein CSC79_05765 [Pseudoalteromonas sp. 3D05]